MAQCGARGGPLGPEERFCDAVRTEQAPGGRLLAVDVCAHTTDDGPSPSRGFCSLGNVVYTRSLFEERVKLILNRLQIEETWSDTDFPYVNAREYETILKVCEQIGLQTRNSKRGVRVFFDTWHGATYRVRGSELSLDWTEAVKSPLHEWIDEITCESRGGSWCAICPASGLSCVLGVQVLGSQAKRPLQAAIRSRKL